MLLDATILPISAEALPLVINDDGIGRVGKTRVTLDTVVSAFHNGATAEEIVQQYPSLYLADVYAVIAYYLQRRAEVDAYLRQCREHSQRVQQQNEARFDSMGIRERLLSRRRNQGG